MDATPATTDNCRYCLMCRHVCPVGHVTRRETLTPHGWALTIASVRRGLLAWDDDSVDVLFACADCGACRAHCVTDQPLPDAIAAARAEVVQAGLEPPAVSDVARRLRKWSNPYREKAPSPPNVADAEGADALFVGDDALHLRPSALDAAHALLRAAGVRPALIGLGRSNGYLPASLGLRDVAAEVARANLDEVRHLGVRRLFVLAPGDLYAFRDLYSDRIGEPFPADVQLVEVVAYLAERHANGSLPIRTMDSTAPYTYLDPTHSVRTRARCDAPRGLLAAALGRPGREMFWRKERAHPCGNTALQFSHPHIAEHLTYARLDDARRAGAETVITEDPGCLEHLGRHAARFGLNVEGLYELLSERLVV
jgi:Fe-S oxidoreductase